MLSIAVDEKKGTLYVHFCKSVIFVDLARKNSKKDNVKLVTFISIRTLALNS